MATFISTLQLEEAGYTKRTIPAEWEDTGGPESGPCITGHDEFDLWELHNAYAVVVDGKIVETGVNPPEFEDIPF